MFWLRNKKNNFQLHILIWGPEILTVIMIFLILKAVNIASNFFEMFRFLYQASTCKKQGNFLFQEKAKEK